MKEYTYTLTVMSNDELMCMVIDTNKGTCSKWGLYNILDPDCHRRNIRTNSFEYDYTGVDMGSNREWMHTFKHGWAWTAVGNQHIYVSTDKRVHQHIYIGSSQ